MLDSIAIPVAGVEPAVEFFVGVLGATVEYTDPAGAAMIRLGATSLKLVESNGDGSGRQPVRLSLYVDDLDAAARSIEQAGHDGSRALGDSGLPLLTIDTPWRFVVELLSAPER